ncbi:Hypothetical predicted protein [Mytilus galloprovincialis]|uniref:ZP domain-containing protein n=1 Tax=Mytilus galloprovincialis TaxID=29158 RepID=A0A8B6BK86_MYTGA|nr:Hypothetical predicted protein [Mytilus galloprovincialis]
MLCIVLERRDAIKIGCGPASWDITVNMTIMKKLYPDTFSELIYFPDAGCKGVWRDDTLFFSQKYTECRTQREDRVSSVLYKNRLMYPEANTPNPVVIRHFRWTIDIDCELSKINSATVNFHPNEIISTTVSSHGGHGNVDHISGSGKEGVIIAFFKDQHFLQQISGNPLQIHIGENIYVKVKTQTTDNNYKMRLHSCVAKPQSYSSATYAYPLIQDGCPTDSTTKIISQTTHETTFVFSSFEFQTNKDNVFVECNATFCLTGDNSVACHQACHTKRSVARIPDTSFIEIGYSRPFRVLFVEDSSNHSHDVNHNVDQQKGSKQNILDKEESIISKI